MKFSFPLPTCTEGLNQPPGAVGPSELIEFARAAESLGFYALWPNDHLTPWPTLRAVNTKPLNWYETLITSACCAAVTTTIKLGLGVIVVPFREPVLLAKQLATLDVLSGGRVLFGVGIGTVREEFEALRPRQARANRGRMLDETLAAIEQLFNEPEASFSGEYYAFEKVSLNPKPLQRPLPIYVSGNVAATLERAARYGAGLMVSWALPADLRARVDNLEAALEKVGREISEIDVTVCPVLSLASSRERAVERFLNAPVGHRFTSWTEDLAEIDGVIRRQMIGTPEEVAELIGAWAEAGMTHCAPQHIAAQSCEEITEQMHMFAEELFPLCESL